MSTHFDVGRYLVRVEHQRFLESKQKGTLGFCLTFRVQKNLDKPAAEVKQLLRDTTLWINENTVERVLHDLGTLGYAGDSLAGVDPDSPNFFDFSGQEVELTCTHECNEKGNVFESWSLAAPAKPNLKDKSKLRRFDRFLTSRGHANGSAADGKAVDVFSQGITDADVPF